MSELLIILVVLAFLGVMFAAPLVALVLAIVLWRRLGDVRQRLEQLEAAALPAAGARPAPPRPGTASQAGPIEEEEEILTAEPLLEGAWPPTPGPPSVSAAPPAARVPVAAPPPPDGAGFSWEMFIGRKALGWVSVVLLIFGAAFFLRYAFENNWVGPLGRVAIGVLIGLALCVAAARQHRRGWTLFAQMLTAAGTATLFLSFYAAFGFYHLLPQSAAFALLLVVVVEAALLAVVYDSWALALMSLIGGLLTPVLLHAPQDQYQAFFLYLAALNLGVVLLAVLRDWRLIGTVALLGTQALFWMWYAGSYHPEKLGWALGFQAALFLIYLLHSLAAHVFVRRAAGWQDLLRLMVHPALVFTAAFVLLAPDYRVWMGSLAVATAALYVALGRVVLWRRPEDPQQLLALLAVAVGFLALAIPLEAKANWVSLGWAATAAGLWWFGLRTQSAALRAMGAALGLVAVGRLLTVDTPWHTRDPFLPLVSAYGLPALGVCACWLGCVLAARRYFPRMGQAERILSVAAGIVGVLLLWLVLSVETYGYFDAWGAALREPTRWRWLGQMSLSALWGAYAMAVLVIGFVRRATLVRWTALALFGVTVLKVFLVDMAGVQELYRILAFVAVAVLLGVAGRAYQAYFRKETAAAAALPATPSESGFLP